MRPEDRYRIYARRRTYRYQLAKLEQPEAVAAYEARRAS